MQKNVKCVIITPFNYEKSKEQFPVVYLLHGHSGNYAQWLHVAPQLKNKVDELQIIIVCPDGGFNSWYFDSEIDSSIRYETFISKELVKFIDRRYNTIAKKNGRAITGFSMGGHGALYISIKHKDLYGAAGSISGGVDIRPFPNKWDIKKVLGDTICCDANWQKNTVINVVDSLKNGELKLIFDCGVDDFFLQVNRNLHQKLLALKIDHDYTERPGAHNPMYWKNSIDYQLLFFNKFFEQQLTISK
jgi:S-formylglutathione hydrolase FrmB